MYFKVVISFLLFVALGFVGALPSMGQQSVSSTSILEHTIYSNQIDTKVGLPSNSINDITQAVDGFLWVATDNGLVRYGGQIVEVYGQSDYGGQYSNNITSVLEVEPGVIWFVIDKKHLLEYDVIARTFDDVDKRFNDIISNNSALIYRLHQTPDGRIWTCGHNFLRFFSKDSIESYATHGNEIFDILPEENERIWLASHEPVGTYGGTLPKVNSESIEHAFHLTRIETDDLISSNTIFKDKYGDLWFGLWKGQIAKQELTDAQPADLRRMPLSLDQNIETTDLEVTSIAEGLDNEIWAGTNIGGLFRINRLTGDIKNVNIQGRAKNISKIFNDRQGRIWIGTKKNGLHVVDPQLNQVKNYTLDEFEANAFLKLNDSILLIGGNGLYRFNRHTSALQAIPFPDAKQETTVYSMTSYGDRVFIGTNNSILQLKNGTKLEKSNFQHIDRRKKNLDLENLQSTRVQSLAVYELPSRHNARRDNAGNYFLDGTIATLLDTFFINWGPKPCQGRPFLYEIENPVLIAACYGFGIVYIDINKKIGWHDDPKNEKWGYPGVISDNRITKVKCDANNSLWFLSEIEGAFLSRGLVLQDSMVGLNSSGMKPPFDYNPCLSKVFNKRMLNSSDYAGDHFTDLIQLDSFHYFLTNAQGELIHLNRKENSAKVTSSVSSMYLGVVSMLDSVLWLANNEGVEYFDMRAGRHVLLNKQDGIAYAGTGYLKQSGTDDVFLAGQNGFSKLNITSYTFDSTIVEPMLTGVNIMDRPCDSLIGIPSIKLPYNKNFIDFSISGLCLVGGNQVDYAYRLTGLQDQWKFSNGRARASYFDVQPGSYVLESYTINADGFRSDVKQLITIEIAKPFWGTSWFISLSFLSLLGVVYYFYRSRLARAERFAKAQIRTEILTQEAERKRLALELHDDFGVRISALKMYINAIENVVKSKNEKVKNLTQHASELVDDSMRELRVLLTNLQPKVLAQHGLVTSVQRLIDRVDLVSPIAFSFESTYEIDVLSNEEELILFRIVQELLANAMKHSNAAAVKVKLCASAQEVTLDYSDDGVGFDLQQMNKGFGLNNLKNRIEMIGGVVHWDTSPGNGVRVRFVINLKNNR